MSKIWHYHHLTSAGGDLKSLKVHYWRSYAMLVLKYKHLNKLRFIILYFDFLLRNIVKFLLYSLLNSKIDKFRKSKINFLVFKYFTKWVLTKKKPNTGFNPVGNKA